MNTVLKYLLSVVCCYLLCSFFIVANGQVSKKDTVIIITNKTDVDALFKQARNLAGTSDNEQARRICLKILEKRPEYYDVRVFLARTYAWEKDFENARTELGKVLIEKENDYEALSTLIDVEMWSVNYDVANEYLKLALTLYPTSEELLIKKAKNQIRQENTESAAITLRKVLDLNPGNKAALNLMVSLSADRLNNQFQVSYDSDFFDKIYKPQQQISASIGRSFRFGSVIMRGNAANRFDNQGIQYEVETYMHFTKSSYTNATFGTSTSKIYPELNYALEIYQRLPWSFELSGGMRYLKFTTGTSVFTASLSNYFKSYWISGRAYITPRGLSTLRDGSFIKNASQTYQFRLRRYLEDADHFAGIRLGYGDSPDLRPWLLNENVRLTTLQVGLEVQRRAFGRYFIQGDVNYANQEFSKNVVYQRISVGLQIKTNF